MLNFLTDLDHLLNVLLPFVAAALFVLLTVFTVAKQRRERQRREAAMLAALARSNAPQAGPVHHARIVPHTGELEFGFGPFAARNVTNEGVHGHMGVQARITMPF
ncbi:hypothetical protein [Cupriavidus malaysiensis]|uniref:Uncharacterized protein n=1 Tax=Cupriavidus malaysiensis TaxID=367825 RepID=A0A1D9I1A8_9BURK|nr:hypothetical protein [Cupriavidus malaysiensis]AOZ05881.1 hypothetical protein BKK80_08655 [Cupriavidus malaysiensis]